jgi:hypothetical protein
VLVLAVASCPARWTPDVVHRDHADLPIVVADDGKVEQVVLGDQEGDVDEVGVRVHPDGIVVGDLA